MSERAYEVPEVVTRYSPRMAKYFESWLRGYFAKNFDAVRLCRDAELSGEMAPELTGPGSRPVLVYSNHPSWWDPIHFLLLARLAMPGRRMFGPFDAEALEQYGFFKRIGGFGIDTGTRRGAAEFLRTGRGILAAPGTTLWITAQGEFSDVRTRPVALRPGLAHLVRRLDRGYVIPLAVEYPFWNERHPQALSCFGAPIELDGAARTDGVETWNARLEDALGRTMDRLADAAQSRDPDRFRTLVLGRTGVGGVYDAWRRMKARVRGETFDASHMGDRR
ncbi:MAG: lysophospholipid acyltransferase family protein [Acidobacteriota bacterium]